MTITVAEAGRRGGLAVLSKRGRSFYSEIGKKGQAAMRRQHPDMAKEWGKRGGRPRKLTLAQIVGAERQVRTTKGGCGPAYVVPHRPPSHYTSQGWRGTAGDDTESATGER
jgi:general stress protein YciG